MKRGILTLLILLSVVPLVYGKPYAGEDDFKKMLADSELIAVINVLSTENLYGDHPITHDHLGMFKVEKIYKNQYKDLDEDAIHVIWGAQPRKPNTMGDGCVAYSPGRYLVFLRWDLKYRGWRTVNRGGGHFRINEDNKVCCFLDRYEDTGTRLDSFIEAEAFLKKALEKKESEKQERENREFPDYITNVDKLSFNDCEVYLIGVFENAAVLHVHKRVKYKVADSDEEFVTHAFLINYLKRGEKLSNKNRVQFIKPRYFKDNKARRVEFDTPFIITEMGKGKDREFSTHGIEAEIEKDGRIVTRTKTIKKTIKGASYVKFKNSATGEEKTVHQTDFSSMKADSIAFILDSYVQRYLDLSAVGKPNDETKLIKPNPLVYELLEATNQVLRESYQKGLNNDPVPEQLTQDIKGELVYQIIFITLMDGIKIFVKQENKVPLGGAVLSMDEDVYKIAVEIYHKLDKAGLLDKKPIWVKTEEKEYVIYVPEKVFKQCWEKNWHDMMTKKRKLLLDIPVTAIEVKAGKAVRVYWKLNGEIKIREVDGKPVVR